MQAEVKAVQQAQSIITETALGIWPECTVGSFGSQANATALPGSDIDITILGVMDFDGASGFKRQVTCPSSLHTPLTFMTMVQAGCQKIVGLRIQC